MAETEKLFRVDGLVAVISGGGTGIGLMMAKALALNGANKVYIIGRRLEPLKAAAQASPTGNIIPLQGDVTSKDSLAGMAQQVKNEAGFVNLLICNSGTSGPIIHDLRENPSLSEIKDYMWAWTTESFNSTYALNDTAAFFTVLAFLELLDAGNKAEVNRGGIQSQVVITASIAGLARQINSGVAYMSSKAGAIHLSKMLATYFGRFGIRFNCLAPGIFPSEMTQGLVGKTAGFSTAGNPAGRTGTDEDMRGTILYLASRAGAYLNGMVLLIDGGRLAVGPAAY